MLDKNFTRLSDTAIAEIEDICGYTYNKCLPYLQHTRTAVDVGSKKGAFARHMCQDFDQVIMFDMRPKTQWKTLDSDRCQLYECALGNYNGQVQHSGALTNVQVPGVNITESPIRTLDSFGFTDIDFLKIDVEGDEVAVLEGAVQTLADQRPLIVIEQNHATETYGKGRYGDALRWLEAHSYSIIDYDGMDDWILRYV